jgi:hypothetical protein
MFDYEMKTPRRCPVLASCPPAKTLLLPKITTHRNNGEGVNTQKQESLNSQVGNKVAFIPVVVGTGTSMTSSTDLLFTECFFWWLALSNNSWSK